MIHIYTVEVDARDRAQGILDPDESHGPIRDMLSIKNTSGTKTLRAMFDDVEDLDPRYGFKGEDEVDTLPDEIFDDLVAELEIAEPTPEERDREKLPLPFDSSRIPKPENFDERGVPKFMHVAAVMLISTRMSATTLRENIKDVEMAYKRLMLPWISNDDSLGFASTDGSATGSRTEDGTACVIIRACGTREFLQVPAQAMSAWFKIQTTAVDGWADVKGTEDDGKTYLLELYETEELATREASDFPGYAEGDYRVVSASTPSDCDIY